MKAVIFAGGLSTSIGDDTSTRPKPMIEIGGRPILWHILKTYLSHEIREFIICTGYKGYVIKEYFANYHLHMSDVTFDLSMNGKEVHRNKAEPWVVTIVDTGEETSTGGRLKRVATYLDRDETFCLTYGDALTDLDMGAQLNYHQQRGKLATVTAVRPQGRFGSLGLRGNNVDKLPEKTVGDDAWINAGYFILSRKVLELIKDDATAWESAPMKALAASGQLDAYRHHGFWHCIDTPRDTRHLEQLWASNQAPWKKW